jgi:hypothetical protein
MGGMSSDIYPCKKRNYCLLFNLNSSIFFVVGQGTVKLEKDNDISANFLIFIRKCRMVLKQCDAIRAF